jgi:hypothetical protein
MWDSRKSGICTEPPPSYRLPNISDDVGQPVRVRVRFVVKTRRAETRKHDHSWIFGIDVWAVIAAYILAFLMIVLATQLHAQTFTLLHTFNGGADSTRPASGLTMDPAGRLYGTTGKVLISLPAEASPTTWNFNHGSCLGGELP